MLGRLLRAVVIGIVVGVVVFLLGALLVALNLVSVGNFLETYAALIGLLAGIWHFFFAGPNTAI